MSNTSFDRETMELVHDYLMNRLDESETNIIEERIANEPAFADFVNEEKSLLEYIYKYGNTDTQNQTQNLDGNGSRAEKDLPLTKNLKFWIMLSFAIILSMFLFLPYVLR